MPKLGNTVEECLLTAWLKRKGDAVVAGDAIAEVETDKASFEVMAPADGVLLDTFFGEGALVPVFTSICAIGVPGESTEGLRPGETAAAPESTGRPGAPGLPEVSVAPGLPGLPEVSVAPGLPGLPEVSALSPRARRFARQHGLRPQPAAGSGPGGRILEADLRAQFYSRPIASAAVRRQMARGYVPKGAGSGLGGLIRLRDLEEPATRVSSVRQRIAARVRESLSTTAQYTLNGSANASGLLALRRRMKASPATTAITIGDLVIFCTIRALQLAPELNAEFADGTLRRHAEVHLGFACDTDRGLLVPVVRSSQRLSLPELSRRISELTAQALDGIIAPDDLTGGTFTVSNLGSLGIESFTPVLNLPQVAILGVGAIEPKPARNPDGNIEFIDAIGLSLTLDHQVIDGAPGARFLNLLRHQIENVEALCTT
jgi:pyruvate dehydrogenase E2 component (dihydrolipoamide acetyltransferase)